MLLQQDLLLLDCACPWQTRNADGGFVSPHRSHSADSFNPVRSVLRSGLVASSQIVEFNSVALPADIGRMNRPLRVRHQSHTQAQIGGRCRQQCATIGKLASLGFRKRWQQLLQLGMSLNGCFDGDLRIVIVIALATHRRCS